jgi:hypothetical protein
MEKIILGVCIFFLVLISFGVGVILEKRKLKSKEKSSIVKIEPTF